MKLIARTIVTALIAALAFFAVPTAAQATEHTPACDEAYVHSLEMQVVEQKHDIWSLRATLEEERDEHADELRHRDRVAWEAEQAHDAEVNQYSSMAHAAREDLADAQVEAQRAIAVRDSRIISLRVKVQELRQRLRSR